MTSAAVLCGLGGALPDTAVTKEDLAARFDTSDRWIRTRTGIGRRDVIAPGQATSDLAVEAGASALALHHGAVPPTANVEKVDPDIDVDIDVVTGAPRYQRMSLAASTSLGFGGHNAALVFTAA